MLKKISNFLLCVFVLTLCSTIFYWSVSLYLAEEWFPTNRNSTLDHNPQRTNPVLHYERLLKAQHFISSNPNYFFLTGQYHLNIAPKSKNKLEHLKNSRLAFQKAIESNPADSETYVYLAWNLFLEKKHDSALNHLETAIALEPNNDFIHLYYGLCLHQFIHQFDSSVRLSYYYRANEEFRKAFALNPAHLKNPPIIESVCRGLMTQKKYKEALHYMKDFTQFTNEQFNLHLLKGEIFYNLNQHNPGYSEFGNLLNRYANQKELQVKILKSMIRASKANRHGELLILIAREQIRVHQDQNAKALLEEVEKKFPHYIGVHFYLARIYERAKQYSKAKNYYQIALKKGKKKNEIEEALDRLEKY